VSQPLTNSIPWDGRKYLLEGTKIQPRTATAPCFNDCRSISSELFVVPIPLKSMPSKAALPLCFFVNCMIRVSIRSWRTRMGGKERTSRRFLVFVFIPLRPRLRSKRRTLLCNEIPDRLLWGIGGQGRGWKGRL
jgi:hypothetical protein